MYDRWLGNADEHSGGGPVRSFDFGSEKEINDDSLTKQPDLMSIIVPNSALCFKSYISGSSPYTGGSTRDQKDKDLIKFSSMSATNLCTCSSFGAFQP
jgi:hypothetical protein